MDVSVIADTVTVATQQGVGFTNPLLHRQNCISNSNLAFSARFLQISVVILDALAPPPVKSNPHKTARGTLLRKKQRTRRKWCSSGGYEDGGEFGGQNWDESSWSSSSEFAYGFVYEVIYWIALSTCTQFAFEKVVRIMTDGIGDAERRRFL
ncbi:hypothetical protein GH714_018459 [Hevea brasiliensis]|uniref:Uncharacterized protein n=1 Tax=Hevea brasiliensis TaxID=3981 RepID=A0A6A6MJE1_HEVBR|nr:hypothetical protein GH714_018459 [Hevea brasiliensis]